MYVMSQLFLFLLIGVAARAAQRHNRRFPETSEEYEIVTERVECSPEMENKRNEIIENSKCGAPKDVFVYLKPQAAHEQVNPGAVWVKRCVGLCGSNESKCLPLKQESRQIPVRVYSVKTNKESCSKYTVEEHVTCGC